MPTVYEEMQHASNCQIANFIGYEVLTVGRIHFLSAYLRLTWLRKGRILGCEQCCTTTNISRQAPRLGRAIYFHSGRFFNEFRNF